MLRGAFGLADGVALDQVLEVLGGAQQDVREELAAGKEGDQHLQRARIGGNGGHRISRAGDGQDEAFEVNQRPVGVGCAGQRSLQVRQQVSPRALRRRAGQHAQASHRGGPVAEVNGRQERPGACVSTPTVQEQAAFADVQLSLPRDAARAAGSGAGCLQHRVWYRVLQLLQLRTATRSRSR